MENGLFCEYGTGGEYMYQYPKDEFDALKREFDLYREYVWLLCEYGNREDAADAVGERFGDQSRVHTNDNACLAVFGISIGDFTKAIGETVAMGYDNDCTRLGISRIPSCWYDKFHNTVRTYMNGKSEYRIDEVAADYCAMIRTRLENNRK